MAKTIEIRGFPHEYDLTAPTDAAPVLVFVHGWLLSRQYWQPVIQRLSAVHPCLSYDLRGFGRSQLLPPSPAAVEQMSKGRSPQLVSAFVAPRDSPTATLALPHLAQTTTTQPTRTDRVAEFTTANLEAQLHPGDRPDLGYTPAAYAEDLITLLKLLNLKDVWLVGHSLGGSIALWAADMAPRLVQGVICVNSGGGIYLKEEFERFRAAGQKLVQFRPPWLCRLPLLDHAMARLNVASPIDRVWARQRLRDLVAADLAAAVGTLLDSTTETEVHRLPQVVSRLQQPVHFIAGAQDTIMEPKYVQHLASFHPLFEYCGNNVTEIPQCGHLAMVEQPKAVVNCIQHILATHTA
jgi:2-succinyl-6-hydroxy-2,4-cyclohexadiene-1-carboxylate synthase